jgi:hypothetical protein
MKLRGNAALSLNKRKLLVHRVMEEDWSLSEAARAAEVSERSGSGSASSRLEQPEPPNRYERRRAGALVHVDVKKLGRIERGTGHRVTGRRRGNPTAAPIDPDPHPPSAPVSQQIP